MEVGLDLSSTACQKPDMQQARIEDNVESLDGNPDGNHMD